MVEDHPFLPKILWFPLINKIFHLRTLSPFSLPQYQFAQLFQEDKNLFPNIKV